MNPRDVVVVDPYGAGNRYAPALRARGLVPLCVRTRATVPDLYAGSYRPDDFALELVRDEDDPDDTALLARLRQQRPIAVVPGAETGVELADRLAAELTPDRANAPATTSARRHKGDMVAAVAAAGLATIPTVCTNAPAEVSTWLDGQGLTGADLILKPPKSGGADGLALVRGGHGWRRAFDRILATPNYFGLRNDEVVVQPRIHGTEYVVDTFSHRGRHTVLDVCRYRKTSSSEHPAVYESIEFLPPELPGNDRLVGYAHRVLDALGVVSGAAHTEVMMTAHGPVLVETGARLAGGGLPAMCAVATGDNAIDRTARELAGERDFPDGYRLRMPLIIAFFVARRAGTVRNVAALHRARELVSFRELGLNLRDGDRVEPTTNLLSTIRMGWAVLQHPDRRQLHADYAALRGFERDFVTEA